MDREIIPITRLDAIYDQIDKKADEIARNDTGYIKDKVSDLGSYDPKRAAYDLRVRYLKKLATTYGERLANAEDLIEKMAKAVNDLIGIAYPNVPVLKKAHQIVNDYNAYLESNKTTDDEE